MELQYDQDNELISLVCNSRIFPDLRSSRIKDLSIVPSLLKKRQPLYTVPEAADILNVSEKTVRRRMVEDGRLRHVEGARPVRIAPADLDDFICDHRGP